MQTSVSDDAGEFKVLLTRLVTRYVYKTVQQFDLMLLLTRLPKWLQDVFAQPQCLYQNIGHALRKLVHARPPRYGVRVPNLIALSTNNLVASSATVGRCKGSYVIETE